MLYDESLHVIVDIFCEITLSQFIVPLSLPLYKCMDVCDMYIYFENQPHISSVLGKSCSQKTLFFPNMG